MYVYDCNTILTTATKNRSYKEMMRSFKSLTKDLKIRGIHPGFHFMDNEASTALKLTMMIINLKYQLVPPINNRANNADISIQTSNNHFIALLCSVDNYFHLQLWDRLLQQATISLNLISKSRTLPHISAYTHIFVEFYFKITHLSPPGRILVMNIIPNDRALWLPHGEYGWYIGPATEHYRCHKAYIPKIRAERISDTIEFPPKHISYATDIFHGCNLSFRKRSNLCTTEFSTCKPFSKIRAWAQGIIE